MPVATTHDQDAKTWIITLETHAPVEDIRHALEQAGLTIAEFLLPAGIFIVKGTAAQAEKARRIHGVASVEAEIEFDVGPPDAAVS